MNDLIYRQSAINAIENTECELLSCEWDELTNAIKQAPSAEQDNDMIHLQKEQAYLQGWEEGREALRRAAINAVEKESQVDGAYGYMDTKSIVDLLSDLPSAEPKTGRWVFERLYHEADECICSECGQLMTTAHGKRMRFCPNCGVKMKVTE